MVVAGACSHLDYPGTLLLFVLFLLGFLYIKRETTFVPKKADSILKPLTTKFKEGIEYHLGISPCTLFLLSSCFMSFILRLLVLAFVLLPVLGSIPCLRSTDAT